jgi:hypothetical protein
LAADYPYLFDYYHTHKFPCGAQLLFQAKGGTKSLTGRSRNLTVLLQGSVKEPRP